MNRAAMEASFRLLMQIPRERIRTHEQRPPVRDEQAAEKRGETARWRREQINRMGAEINPATGKRWTLQQMADVLEISKQAVAMHRRVLAGHTYRFPSNGGRDNPKAERL